LGGLRLSTILRVVTYETRPKQSALVHRTKISGRCLSLGYSHPDQVLADRFAADFSRFSVGFRQGTGRYQNLLPKFCTVETSIARGELALIRA
jgi:hypothetical protein